MDGVLIKLIFITCLLISLHSLTAYACSTARVDDVIIKCYGGKCEQAFLVTYQLNNDGCDPCSFECNYDSIVNEAFSIIDTNRALFQHIQTKDGFYTVSCFPSGMIDFDNDCYARTLKLLPYSSNLSIEEVRKKLEVKSEPQHKLKEWIFLLPLLVPIIFITLLLYFNPFSFRRTPNIILGILSGTAITYFLVFKFGPWVKLNYAIGWILIAMVLGVSSFFKRGKKKRSKKPDRSGR